jgi:hypothetical protein
VCLAAKILSRSIRRSDGDTPGISDRLELTRHARAVLKNSGGIQEGTSFLDIACLMLRENRERPVAAGLGTSELVGNEPEPIRNGWHGALNSLKKTRTSIPLWDGHSAQRLGECIRAECGRSLHILGLVFNRSIAAYSGGYYYRYNNYYYYYYYGNNCKKRRRSKSEGAENASAPLTPSNPTPG